jgi:hypothetical protein
MYVQVSLTKITLYVKKRSLKTPKILFGLKINLINNKNQKNLQGVYAVQI